VSDKNEFVLRIDQCIEYLECDGHGNSARDVAAFRDAAVAEITRLRADLAQRTAQRDEARRWVCELWQKCQPATSNMTAMDYAAECGWDCFREEVQP
jgi:hypothetical protein